MQITREKDFGALKGKKREGCISHSSALGNGRPHWDRLLLPDLGQRVLSLGNLPVSRQGMEAREVWASQDTTSICERKPPVGTRLSWMVSSEFLGLETPRREKSLPVDQDSFPIFPTGLGDIAIVFILL